MLKTFFLVESINWRNVDAIRIQKVTNEQETFGKKFWISKNGLLRFAEELSLFPLQPNSPHHLNPSLWRTFQGPTQLIDRSQCPELWWSSTSVPAIYTELKCMLPYCRHTYIAKKVKQYITFRPNSVWKETFLNQLGFFHKFIVQIYIHVEGVTYRIQLK